MKEYQSLSHRCRDRKYHVVYIAKRRKKPILGQLRRHLGEVFHDLAQQRGCQIVEGHLMPDRVHLCISIPPKYSVASAVEFLKGKSPITIARRFGGRKPMICSSVYRFFMVRPLV